MRFSMRPYLMAGVGIVAAGSIAIPPSVAPPSHAVRHESVALAAHTAPVNPLLRQVPEYATAQAAATLLPPEALTSTAALTETLDAAAAQVGALALPGLGNAIIAAYDVIMPWVDWAVNLGIYATEWIPVVNWFTPQISIVYYALIEPIITSAVFNFAFWVGGAESFLAGLTNFFTDTVNAGIGFVNAEIDWFLGFLPPLPPFFPFAAQATMDVMGARTAVQVTAPTDADEPDPETVTEEPTAPQPGKETETAPADEVEGEPTEPAPAEDTSAADPVDEPATGPADVETDLTEDADAELADPAAGTDDAGDSKDDLEDLKDDLRDDLKDTAEDDPKNDDDTDADTKSDGGPDAKDDDEKPGSVTDDKPDTQSDTTSGD